jgi:peptidoglycan hydrolase-like protein with peptidoglycan-binding domain
MKKLLIVTSLCLWCASWVIGLPVEARGTRARTAQAEDRELIIQAQRQLKALGFNPGAIDGNVGPQTEAAVREYQRAYRLPPTGTLDETTVRSLLPERTRSSAR